MATLIDFEELQGSPSYEFTPTGWSAKRKIKCAWDDIDTIVALFSPQPGNIFALFPGLPELWVDSINIEPYPDCLPNGSDANGLPYYPEGALITIDYKTTELQGGQNHSSPASDTNPTQGQSPQASSETILSHKVTLGGEMLILPSSALEWSAKFNTATGEYDPANGSNVVADDVNGGLLVPVIEHDITWHYVVFPPWSSIRRNLGRVNTDSFAGAPRGTLLFLGAEASIEFTTSSTRWWTLDYKFAFKDNTRENDTATLRAGWNYFLRPETGRFEELNRKGRTGLEPVAEVGNPNQGGFTEIVIEPGGPIYAYGDFAPLFRPGL